MITSQKNFDSLTPFHLIIQSNSPGELARWTFPFVQTFKQACPHSKIAIFLTPCQYASGREAEFARNIPGVDVVLSPSETLRHLWREPRLLSSRDGAVMYLGGDPLYSLFLSLKYKYPSYAYTEHRHSPGFFFKKVFYKHQDGDLMAAGISHMPHNREDLLRKYDLPNRDYLLFFCGSRPAHFQALFPFILDVIETLHTHHIPMVPLIGLSPFITKEDVNKAARNRKTNQPPCFIRHGNSLDLLSLSSFLVTLPGTATAEAMYLHVPMLVLVPLNRPDLILFDGLLGVIGQIPALGTALKRTAITFLRGKKRFYSHPNRLLQRDAVPEVIENVTVESVSKKIMDYGMDSINRDSIRQSLTKIIPNDAIAYQICSYILSRP